MSKSLKNFITIQECLNHFTPRTLRLLVLIHKLELSFVTVLSFIFFLTYAIDGTLL
jgi:methionyl-tRNA synthetase